MDDMQMAIPLTSENLPFKLSWWMSRACVALGQLVLPACGAEGWADIECQQSASSFTISVGPNAWTVSLKDYTAKDYTVLTFVKHQLRFM